MRVESPSGSCGDERLKNSRQRRSQSSSSVTLDWMKDKQHVEDMQHIEDTHHMKDLKYMKDVKSMEDRESRILMDVGPL